MSLYTPIFPPTDPPAARTPSSSSLTSVETAKQARGVSYSSRLSQWHLAIASLPEELCPPSAPSSPNSQERSAKLQAEIEQAVHEGRPITDFCKLRSSKLGYATRQPAYSGLEQGEEMPWILAETEEEWFEWERKMAQRRSRQKGKDRATLAPPPTQSQNAHDKVLSWKAGLQPPSSSPVTASSTPPVTTGRSSLGFPVVKRSSMLKESKLKATKATTPLDPAPRPNSEAQNIGEQSPVLQVDTRTINAVHVDTGDVDHSNSYSDLRRISSNPPSEAKEEISVSEAPENAHLELCDFSSFPPLSFPSDLLTSTQKDAVGLARAISGPPPSFPPNLPTSTPKDVYNTDMTVVANDLEERRTERPSTLEDQLVRDGLAVEPPDQQVPQPTPPSPPYSSTTSRPLIQQHTATTSAQAASSQILPIPATSPNKHVRPLTPPPEDNVPVSNGILSSPRTPERQPTKKYRTLPHTKSYGSGGVGGGITDGPTTPDSAINGAGVARGMAFPRTPERQVFADLLATSRKSLPRPRPPSRKQFAQNMDIDGAASEAGGDPSPAKSDRSYFSSPASGSSSGSSRGSMQLVPGSPTSPLGFTQNPSLFVPLGESTQVSPKARLGRSLKPLGSQTSARRGTSQTQTQKSLGGASSGMLGMGYNSQFDVEGKVDQLNNFMRQDVDLDAWVRDTDDEDDVAVEKLTYPTSPLGS